MIEWVDRETLRYSEEGRSVLAWVDYSLGFFSNGRILRTESLKHWQRAEGGLEEMTASDVARVVEEIRKHYRSEGVSLSVE